MTGKLRRRVGGSHHHKPHEPRRRHYDIEIIESIYETTRVQTYDGRRVRYRDFGYKASEMKLILFPEDVSMMIHDWAESILCDQISDDEELRYKDIVNFDGEPAIEITIAQKENYE